MSYPEDMQASIKKVEKTRRERMESDAFPMLSPEEKEDLLQKYHPDYRDDAFRQLKIGANSGDSLPHEVVDILEARSMIDPDDFDLEPDRDVDVLIIGGGGAGCSASLVADEMGADVLQVTKLRMGDANTMMAQGGIQIADKENDSPAIHYLDVMGGGGFENKPDLVKALVMDGPRVARWLEELGYMFDKDEDGRMVTRHGGGTSRMRMHSARDYSGAEVMRTLRDEVQNRDIEYIEFSPAVELLLDDDGSCSGAVIYDLELEEYMVVRARSVIMATGGFGRIHVSGFPTTNHYGATADGLVMAYRAGANLLFMDSTQFHPTGAAFPEQIVGLLITEKVRGLGAHVVNAEGEQFVYPLETRDAEASAIIRECEGRDLGVTTPTGMTGVWLDSPMIDQIHGEGTLENELPAMYRQFDRFGIDITENPMLVFPTLHYQNGGVEIDDSGETAVENLFIAGETSGGVHGKNRLMGNSLLEVLVFGRRAGRAAAERAQNQDYGDLTLEHVRKYHSEMEAERVETDRISPLLLPDYREEE